MAQRMNTGTDGFEYIARISHGKDSLKMLDVIFTRGLRLDRITTTDIWATDTIRGEHPKMVEFKDMGDEYIWRKYRIEVEHLCARNPDGTKKTYEQMFYHVPIRRSQTVQVERERERVPAGDDSRIPGPVECVVSGGPQASTRGCRRASLFKEGLGAKNSSIYGFPVSLRRRGQWCQKLKTRVF